MHDVDEGGSQLARELRALNPAILPRLQIMHPVLALMDAVVTGCNLLNDPSDQRSWDQKLESFFTEQCSKMDHDEILRLVEGLADPDSQQSLERWARRIKSGGYVSFARRLVGAGKYDKLERAYKEDAAIVALALRRAVRAMMPYCVAWEDALTAITPGQLRAVTAVDLIGVSAAKLAVQLDQILGERFLSGLSAEVRDQLSEANTVPLDVAHLSEALTFFRPRVSQQSASQIAAMNAYLARKLSGARHALEHSDDGVSQAANSLIELIDRLLREQFDQDSVLEWVAENIPDDPSLIFVDQRGAKRATKMAEALCFVYGGAPVRREPTEHDSGQDPTLIHIVTARAIVAARSRLQTLKHADGDGDLDRATLEQMLASVEGALMIGLRLGFSPQSTPGHEKQERAIA